MVRGLFRHFDPTRDASSAIFGTIITAVTIITESDGATGVDDVVLAVAVTLTLYWIAHSYALVLGRPDARNSFWTSAARELGAEWPMVTACFLPLVVMVGFDVLGAGLDVSATIAVWFATGLLVVWGYLAARRAQASGGLRILSAAVFGVLGIVIIGLKSLLRH